MLAVMRMHVGLVASRNDFNGKVGMTRRCLPARQSFDDHDRLRVSDWLSGLDAVRPDVVCPANLASTDRVHASS